MYEPTLDIVISYKLADEEKVKILIKDIYTKHVHSISYYASDGSTSEIKKAQRLKRAFGAQLDPFVGIYLGKKILKGFYSETNECTLDNINTYLKNYTNECKNS